MFSFVERIQSIISEAVAIRAAQYPRLFGDAIRLAKLDTVKAPPKIGGGENVTIYNYAGADVAARQMHDGGIAVTVNRIIKESASDFPRIGIISRRAVELVEPPVNWPDDALKRRFVLEKTFLAESLMAANARANKYACLALLGFGLISIELHGLALYFLPR